jgi:hypothetical protein
LLDFRPDVCRTANPQLPNNCQLYQFDLREDFKHHPEWAGQINLIHQRLMSFALDLDQWRLVLKNYFDALKPGGYLQLFEFDTTLHDDNLLKRGPWWMFAFEKGAEIAEKKGIKHDFAKDLPSIVEQVGFQIVSNEEAYMDFNHVPAEPEPVPGAAALWHKFGAYAFSQKARELGSINQEEWSRFEEGIENEWETSDRSQWRMRAFVIVAQVSCF